jgi:hypothetical protein
MASRLIYQIHITAQSQRMSGWGLLIIALIVFGISVPFIRLLILELQKVKSSSSSIGFLVSIIALFLSLDVWIFAVYKNPQDVELRLFEDRLEVSNAISSIPLANMNANIGPFMVSGVLGGIPVTAKGGEGLILNITNSAHFLKTGFVDQFSAVYGEKNRMRFLIGRMISKDQADSFIEHLNTLKSAAKTSP